MNILYYVIIMSTCTNVQQLIQDISSGNSYIKMNIISDQERHIDTFPDPINCADSKDNCCVVEVGAVETKADSIDTIDLPHPIIPDPIIIKSNVDINNINPLDPLEPKVVNDTTYNLQPLKPSIRDDTKKNERIIGEILPRLDFKDDIDLPSSDAISIPNPGNAEERFTPTNAATPTIGNIQIVNNLRTGLKAPISILKVRKETMKVLYKGLCKLCEKFDAVINVPYKNDRRNENTDIYWFKTNPSTSGFKIYKHTYQEPNKWGDSPLTGGAKKNPEITINFNINGAFSAKQNADDADEGGDADSESKDDANRAALASPAVKNLDSDMLICMSYLELILCKIGVNNTLYNISTLAVAEGTKTTTEEIKEMIINIIDCFILISSGKEYLDVGQLYAIIDHINDWNSLNNYTDGGICSKFNIVNDDLSFTNCDTVPCDNFPKRPFFETKDNSAVRIAGKFFNSYGEVTISLKDKSKPRPFRERYTLSNNAGIIPYLFDSSKVVYLVFIYNLINKNLTQSINTVFNEDLFIGVNPSNLIDYCNQAPNPGNPDIIDNPIIIINKFNQLIQKIKDNIMLPDNNAKTQNFFYLFYFLLRHFNKLIQQIYNNNSSKEAYILYNIIDDNMYNLLSTVNYLYDHYNNKFLKDLLIICNFDPLCHDNGDNEIYRLLMIYNLIKKARGSTRGLYDLIEKIKNTFNLDCCDSSPPSIQQINKFDSVSNNQLPTNLPGPGDTSKLKLRSFLDDHLLCSFSEKEKKIFYVLSNYDFHKVETCLFNDLSYDRCMVFNVTLVKLNSICEEKILINLSSIVGNSQGQIVAPFTHIIIAFAKLSFVLTGQTPTYYINSQPIIPRYAGCSCDLPLHSHLTLTNKDVQKLSLKTSEFYITPITFNDAASASTQPNVVYLRKFVNIYFGNQCVENIPVVKERGPITIYKYLYTFESLTHMNIYLDKILTDFKKIVKFNKEHKIVYDKLKSRREIDDWFKLFDISNTKIASSAIIFKSLVELFIENVKRQSNGSSVQEKIGTEFANYPKLIHNMIQFYNKMNQISETPDNSLDSLKKLTNIFTEKFELTPTGKKKAKPTLIDTGETWFSELFKNFIEESKTQNDTVVATAARNLWNYLSPFITHQIVSNQGGGGNNRIKIKNKTKNNKITKGNNKTKKIMKGGVLSREVETLKKLTVPLGYAIIDSGLSEKVVRKISAFCTMIPTRITRFKNLIELDSTLKPKIDQFIEQKARLEIELNREEELKLRELKGRQQQELLQRKSLHRESLQKLTEDKMDDSNSEFNEEEFLELQKKEIKTFEIEFKKYKLDRLNELKDESLYLFHEYETFIKTNTELCEYLIGVIKKIKIDQKQSKTIEDKEKLEEYKQYVNVQINEMLDEVLDEEEVPSTIALKNEEEEVPPTTTTSVLSPNGDIKLETYDYDVDCVKEDCKEFDKYPITAIMGACGFAVVIDPTYNDRVARLFPIDTIEELNELRRSYNLGNIGTALTIFDPNNPDRPNNDSQNNSTENTRIRPKLFTELDGDAADVVDNDAVDEAADEAAGIATASAVDEHSMLDSITREGDELPINQLSIITSNEQLQQLVDQYNQLIKISPENVDNLIQISETVSNPIIIIDGVSKNIIELKREQDIISSEVEREYFANRPGRILRVPVASRAILPIDTIKTSKARGIVLTRKPAPDQQKVIQQRIDYFNPKVQPISVSTAPIAKQTTVSTAPIAKQTIVSKANTLSISEEPTAAPIRSETTTPAISANQKRGRSVDEAVDTQIIADDDDDDDEIPTTPVQSLKRINSQLERSYSTGSNAATDEELETQTSSLTSSPASSPRAQPKLFPGGSILNKSKTKSNRNTKTKSKRIKRSKKLNRYNRSKKFNKFKKRNRSKKLKRSKKLNKNKKNNRTKKIINFV